MQGIDRELRLGTTWNELERLYPALKNVSADIIEGGEISYGFPARQPARTRWPASEGLGFNLRGE